LAITGSINQLGEIQAIGGVNEKIEGFFEVCASRGLSGEQGVIIPAANQLHLMLHRDVRAAVREGRFSIYPVRQVTEAMQLLSGLKPGVANKLGKFPARSFNHRIQQRIEKLQSVQRKFMRSAASESATAPAGGEHEG
jgi:predicted ATP-dependent protease